MAEHVRYFVYPVTEPNPGGDLRGCLAHPVMFGPAVSQRQPMGLSSSTSEDEVLAHRQSGEHGRGLVGTRQSSPYSVVKRQGSHIFASEDDPPRIRLEIAAHEVEQRGFSGPVGAEDGEAFPDCDLETHVVDGSMAAE
ncbi:MAG: hypothetical protein OXG57_07465 [Acidimicrobiaceae bacterium]|nr:hypothetical protein [Acidimicrobiaceae bacterium]